MLDRRRRGTAARILNRIIRHTKHGNASSIDRAREEFGIRAGIFADRCPGRVEIASPRGNPTHAGDRRDHREWRSKTTAALAPPKPKEFETTRRIFCGRILLATMSSGNSDWLKLMFDGKEFLAKGETTEGGLDRTCGAESMAGHTLGAADGSVWAECKNGTRFARIVQRRAGSVRIDIVNTGGISLRACERTPHRSQWSAS